MSASGPGDPPRVSQLERVKQEYTAAAREILRRSMQGVAKTKLTPDMLSVAGLALCIAGAVLVGFEQRNEYVFYWLGGGLFVAGSVADILDGALARAASKGTVFGAFLDSTFDRLGEAAVLAAIGLAFMREGNEVALLATFAAVIGSFLVSYTRARAEALGLKGDVGFGSRLERVVIISVAL
ncbi:MAG: CDP-alcohol phosphatidyltransferase family protein, partial [Thermoleophilia bacterium]|nr:CDP-alcohol phosphatidyltransferase family protein [Thermoleophilia bacterium]